MIVNLSLVPNKLYRSARFTECLKALEGDESDEAHIHRARALFRLTRKDDALAELMAVRAVDGDVAAVRAATFARLSSTTPGNTAVVSDWLATARSITGTTAVGQTEIALAEGLVAESAGNAEQVRAAVLTMKPDAAGAWYRSMQLACLAEAVLLEGKWDEHARLREHQANYMLSNPDAMDVFLLALCLQALSTMACERHTAERFAFAVDVFDRIPWTPDIAYHRFLIKRSIAWGHGLRGSERIAHRMLFELIDEVPSPQVRPLIYVDHAYLFRAAGNEDVANAWLEKAINFTRALPWETELEERLDLLTLAELAADYDPDAARALLEKYDGIATPLHLGLALVHNDGGRRQAMEDRARGAVLAATGETHEALRLLQRAYSAFSGIGFTWRAASASLCLYALTGDRTWLRKAEEAVVEFPDSAIAREVRRKAHGAANPRLASLSPTQRRVFELLCQGKSNKEIATALVISVNTARNHVAAVLARFDAHSRAHLAAVARESGLLT